MTIQTLSFIAPELEAVALERRQFFMAQAEDMAKGFQGISPAAFDRASSYLAAHLLTVSNRGGSGGTVVKEKVGDVEVGYAAPSSGSSAYEGSAYGREYSAMIKIYFSGPLVG